MSRIPGLEDGLQELLSGGDESHWLPYKNVKLYTNAFIVQKGKILLGLKKRGFGINKYNGFGGKVELHEPSIDAAVRELKEEAGIEAPLRHVGVLFFLTEDTETAFHIDIYQAKDFTGSITESDEMRPEWFSTEISQNCSSDSTDPSKLPPIPYDQMWETDRYWIPLLLSESIPFYGRADFKMQNGKLLPSRWWFGGR